MRSMDTSLNSSATIALQDFYRRWVRPDADEAQSLRFLRVMTVIWGGIGTGVALAMMGVESILDAWWKLSGVFAGGMLGLGVVLAVAAGVSSVNTYVPICGRWP